MGLEMNSAMRPLLILWDFVTAWRRLELKASRSAMMMIAKEAGAEHLLVMEWMVWMWTRSAINVPPISNISARERFSGVPLHSRALMPKREVKKDSGRKLLL